MITAINKSLVRFAHWANKEQIASVCAQRSRDKKRKEQLILRRVIPAQAGMTSALIAL